VFNVSELDQTITIGPDGKVSILLLDVVDAAGLTTAKLDEMITARYAGFYRDPQVTVNVKSYANQKIYVTGEVQQPGLLPLAGEMSAGRAVIQAGGLKPSAKSTNVILVRKDGNGAPVVTRLDLGAVFRGTAQDVPLMPFDVVYVPRSKIARVDEFMNQYVKQLVPVTLSAGFSYLLNNPLVAR
jgi:protein involved in polysaccharide export with SLBB domain